MLLDSGRVAFETVFVDLGAKGVAVDTKSVGGPEENFIVREILTDLPIRVAGNSIELFGEKFVGRDLGLTVIYPNPTYPNRYVRFLLATSPAGLFGLDTRCDEQFDFHITDGRTV